MLVWSVSRGSIYTSFLVLLDGRESTVSRSNNRKGWDECSIPKPDIITLISESRKISTSMTSFSMTAAVWSVFRLMFKLPIITKRIPTMSCNERQTQSVSC